MNIAEATYNYEQWLTTYTPLVQADIETKHTAMKADAFSFLRATFYRWAQVWPGVCGDLAASPSVLGVGDLHVENFGTWRDREGRLCWGVNDFDEACPLPYANDLVRLATSALLAIAGDNLQCKPKDACDAIINGYTAQLQAGGPAFVLAEQHGWLRDIAVNSLKKPEKYWPKMDALPPVTETIPESATVALEHSLPAPGLAYQVRHRTAGLGSLGHPRYVAIAEFESGRIAREAKALVPSATVWANAGQGPIEYFYQAIMDRAVRSHDPFVSLQGHWIVRRLAPDCSRVELTALPDTDTEAQLLEAMGAETANIHMGSKDAIAAVQQDLTRRDKGWLQTAASAMMNAIQEDWKAWKT